MNTMQRGTQSLRTLAQRRLSWLRLNRLSITARLHIGFGVVLVLLGLVGAQSWLQASSMSARMHRVVKEDALRSTLANDMQIAVQQMVIGLGNLCLIEDAEEIERQQIEFRAALDRYEKFRQAMASMPVEGADTRWKQALDHVVEVETSALTLFTQMATLAGTTDRQSLTEYFTLQVSSPQAVWMESLDQLRRAMTASMVDASERSNVEAGRSQLVTVVVLVLALVGGLLSAVLISRSIGRPLNDAVALANSVAQGDLSRALAIDRYDEIGALLRALEEMQRTLRHLVGNIHQCADSIHAASGDVASGNTDLSQRTEATASSLQRTASSLDELTETVRQSAAAAATANDLAASASDAARHGAQVVQQVVVGMDEISVSSRKIADIIGVIDGIAFQTNLLALNASVEAARAGDQGRGFGVVAGEVHTLAQQAATSAREIKQLIGTSVERVRSGTKLVQEAGETMQGILTAVQRVSDVVGQITAVMADQNAGIDQVSGAVTRLDHITQQNAALVEQSAAAAESLHAQAGRLKELVGMFSLDRADLDDTVLGQ